MYVDVRCGLVHMNTLCGLSAYFTPHSEGVCANQFEMHLITSWPFVSVQTRPIALFDLLSTRLVYSDPHNKCVNALSYSLLFSLYVMCSAGG